MKNMMMKYDVFSSSSTHHQTKMQRPDNPFLSSFSCCSTGKPSKPAKPRCDVLSPGRERMPNLARRPAAHNRAKTSTNYKV